MTEPQAARKIDVGAVARAAAALVIVIAIAATAVAVGQPDKAAEVCGLSTRHFWRCRRCWPRCSPREKTPLTHHTLLGHRDALSSFAAHVESGFSAWLALRPPEMPSRRPLWSAAVASTSRGGTAAHRSPFSILRAHAPAPPALAEFVPALRFQADTPGIPGIFQVPVDLVRLSDPRKLVALVLRKARRDDPRVRAGCRGDKGPPFVMSLTSAVLFVSFPSASVSALHHAGEQSADRPSVLESVLLHHVRTRPHEPCRRQFHVLCAPFRASILNRQVFCQVLLVHRHAGDERIRARCRKSSLGVRQQGLKAAADHLQTPEESAVQQHPAAAPTRPAIVRSRA